MTFRLNPISTLPKTKDEIQRLFNRHVPENTVIVKSTSDLSGSLMSDKVYIVDGTIDMGTQTITVPEGGLSIAGLNGSRDVAVLTSSENSYTMFITDTYSGDVFMENLTITVDGTSSQVFDLDNNENNNALDISNVNFVSCTSLGDLTDYRQLLLSLVGFIGGGGLTFNGTWSGGVSAINSIAINFPADTLFKEGTSLTIAGSVRSNINFLSVNAAAILFDFVEANILADGGMDLNDVRTTATDAVPNIDHNSVKARFRNCSGLDNTYVGAEYSVTTASATTIAVANTLYKMAGTTTYSEEHWFSNTTDNAFVYDSSLTIEIDLQLSLSFSGTNNNVIGIQFRQWDDSASAYVDIGSQFTATLNAAGRAENVTAFARARIGQNDRIEVWVENQTGANNVTALVGGFVGVEERPS